MINKMSAFLNSVIAAGLLPRAERISLALGLFLSLSPAIAASPCPNNYGPFSFQGTVAEIGTTADGRPFYVITNISNPACGDEHKRIRAYPLATVASCAVGKSVTASGTYTKSCVDVGKASFCLAQVGLRNSQGAIDTTKGAIVICK